MPRRRGRRQFRGRKRSYAPRTKKLITGHGDSRVESIARGFGAVANLARAIVPIIKPLNTEVKYTDNTGTTAAIINGTWNINFISGVGQGTQDNNRIGNSILAKDLYVRFSWTPNYTSASYNVCRLILLVDKESYGVVPTQAQIFENVGTWLSPLNKEAGGRFVILMDKFMTLSNTGNNTIQLKKFIRLDNHIKYIGTDATQVSAGQNNIYLVAGCGNAANGPQLTWYSRLNFTDT